MTEVLVSKLSSGHVAVQLEEPGGTGFSWKIVNVDGAKVLRESLEVPKSGAIGAANNASFEFELDAQGTPAGAVLELSAPFAPSEGEKVKVDLITGKVQNF